MSTKRVARSRPTDAASPAKPLTLNDVVFVESNANGYPLESAERHPGVTLAGLMRYGGVYSVTRKLQGLVELMEAVAQLDEYETEFMAGAVRDIMNNVFTFDDDEAAGRNWLVVPRVS